MLNIQKSIGFIVSVLFLSLIVFCSENRPFVKLENPKKDKGILYVIRPFHPSLAVWSYDFQLEKFKGHFKTKGETQPISKFNLSNGEYFNEELEEGFYLLKFSSQDGVEKIFKIENGKRSFLQFVIFNEKKISIPDFFIKEIQESDALGDLLEDEHMNETTIKKVLR